MSFRDAIRVIWRYSSILDKFLVAAIPLAPVLILLNLVNGPKPPTRIFWVFYPIALIGILVGWMGILLIIYRECKEKGRKETLDRNSK